MDRGKAVPVPKKVNEKVEKWQNDMFADMIKEKKNDVEHVEANLEARCITAKGWEEREDNDDDRFNATINRESVMLRKIS